MSTLAKFSSRDTSKARRYKAKADEVLLSRGKSGGVRIDAKGKTTDQIFDMLMGLQSAK